MGGTVHPYYAVALAPAIAALVGIGSVELWRGRAYWPARVVLAVTVLATSVWSAVLLGRDPAWLPGLRVIAVVLGVLAAAALLLRADSIAALPARFRKAATTGVVILSLLAGGLGTTAWTLATAAQPHSGSIPTSGTHRVRDGRRLRGGRQDSRRRRERRAPAAWPAADPAAKRPRPS